MITMTALAASAVTRSWKMATRVESWLGDQLLADDVPVVSAAEEQDSTLRVPERLTLTVPRLDRGVSYAPDTATAPLAAYGQRLRASIGVDLGANGIEWLQRGWFTIAGSSVDGDTVSVEAVGLLGLIEEARFTLPYQPTGTFDTTIRSLVEPALTVDLSAAPTGRAVPASMSWDEDRLGAVFELADAWPARVAVDAGGVLIVTPDTDATVPVLTLTDGVGGTVVQWAGSTTRDGGRNMVVARGQAADGTQVQGQTLDTTPTSPTRFGGPFNALPVPEFFFSPLLTTNAQAKAAAATILRRRKRESARRLRAEAVPNPAVQLGDLVTVTGAGLTAAACLLEAFTMPHTPGSGPMTLSLRVL